MKTRFDSNLFRRAVASAAIAAMLAPGLAPGFAPMLRAQSAEQQGGYTYRVNSDLVLVSVTARDKSGNIIRDLKQSDFTVLEDGKAQKIASFDTEDAETFAQTGPTQAESITSTAQVLTAKEVVPAAVRDRRLIVLFFDLSAMEADELERAMDSARNFVNKQMTPADLVAVVSFDSALKVLQDFTSERAQLTKTFDSMQGIEGEGMQNGGTGDSTGGAETGQAFAADDTDYNEFNTDRRLQAIQSLAEVLSKIDQKKAVLYFSGGLTKTGTENQAQLRAATNAAVRANVSIYPVDSRGLQAMPPGGSAQTASLRGTGAYSGRAVQDQFDSQFASQETLSTIAEDTGGKAFLDENDFSKAFQKVQADTSTYYVLGYRSTNSAMDGHYRKIAVKVNRPGVKLEYRTGYYGPRDFKHYTQDDREQQLEQEMMSDLPNTDLPVYVSTEYFRGRDGKMFVPVSIVVPGSAIPFVQGGDKDEASIDIYGFVRETQTKFPVGQIRETVKLNVDGTQQVRQKNVQYNTGFLLPAGKFHIKLVVRENQNGRMGSFETDVTVPDLRKQQLKMSTVVMASQKAPAQKKSQNPLVKDGVEIIPNVAHVFLNNQPMLFYYEVYDPAKNKAAEGLSKEERAKAGSIRLLTSIQFFKGKVKAYETPMVEARELTVPERKAAAFQFEVPTAELKPGWYTCQINVVDDAGGTFSFPRLPLLIRGADEAKQPSAQQ